MSPVISAIIPVYNREKYISYCIDSILAQTFDDFELILVDDGSKDESPAICDKYAEKDERVTVIHKENGGVSSARNAGLGVARGEYITFIDSDDYIDKDFFKLACEKMSDDVDIFVGATVVESWKDGEIKGETLFTTREGLFDIKQALEFWAYDPNEYYWYGPCCKLYRRKHLIDAQILFDVSMRWGEDTSFNLDVFVSTKKVYCSERVFYHYRRGDEGSLYSSFRRDAYEVLSALFSKREELMRRLDCSEESVKALRKSFFEKMFVTVCEYRAAADLTTKKEKQELLKAIAQNEQIKSIKVKDINSYQKKLLLILLRLKLYGFTWWVFNLYFKIRLKNKET